MWARLYLFFLLIEFLAVHDHYLSSEYIFKYIFKNVTQRLTYMGCSFKLILKVGIEESIVNAPLVRQQSKNTNEEKSEVRFN
jgi:hypothetical protein